MQKVVAFLASRDIEFARATDCDPRTFLFRGSDQTFYQLRTCSPTVQRIGSNEYQQYILSFERVHVLADYVLLAVFDEAEQLTKLLSIPIRSLRQANVSLVTTVNAVVQSKYSGTEIWFEREEVVPIS